jgi:hypothetical protein
MAQFKAFDAKAEVNGETVLSVVDGMGAFKKKALEILKSNGIDEPKPGKWYPQQKWLDAFKDIATKIGDHTLFSIGQAIPRNAQWPPFVNSIETALGSIDIAYHMNHRINGKVLFDPTSGKMSEGIGHYSFQKTGEKSGKVVCNNPYPCAFDKGIIESAANKFAKAGDTVKVNEELTINCRKKNADSCTYTVNW